MIVCLTEYWSSYIHNYTRRLSTHPECGHILSFGGPVMRDNGEGRLCGWEIQFIAAGEVEKATKAVTVKMKGVIFYKAFLMHRASTESTQLVYIIYIRLNRIAAFNVPYHSVSMLNPIDLKNFALECRNCPSVFKLSNFTWSLYRACRRRWARGGKVKDWREEK